MRLGRIYKRQALGLNTILPHGKKKIRQQEKEAAEKAAKAYEARKNPVQESEEKKPLSGDPERPYSRGRAYDPAHYGRKRPAGSDAEQTEE